MKLIRILDRLIIKEIKGPFCFGVMAFTLIMVAGGLLFKLADLIIERGVSLGIAARLFIYELPSVVVLTLPMSCLLATLLGFSKMASNSEIVALKAAGISFKRISRPVIIASILVSLFSLALNETLVPLGKRASENVMRFEVMREKPAMLKEQVFLRETGSTTPGSNRIVYINKLMPRTGKMEDIVIQEFQNSQLWRITTASSGEWANGTWNLTNGDIFEVKPNKQVELTMHFQKQKLPLPLSPQQVARTVTDPEELNAIELLSYIKIMKVQGANLAPLWVTFHLRLAVPWACVILALIGTSLGIRQQRRGSSSLGFGQSILIVFVYYVFMSMGRAFGQSGYLTPFLGAWLPNIVFLICGAFMARKGDR